MTDPFISAVQPYTVIDTLRLESLQSLCRELLLQGVPGDVVECGTASGGSAAVLARAMFEAGRHIWLFDSFEGLPTPTPVDGPAARLYTGAHKADLETVWCALRLSQCPEDRIHVVPGWFNDTFLAAREPTTIALLHIDADWYESVASCLARWYDAVSPSGVIVLDDFGLWRGCRLAFYEFCAQRRIGPDLHRVGAQQAYWVKGE